MCHVRSLFLRPSRNFHICEPDKIKMVIQFSSLLPFNVLYVSRYNVFSLLFLSLHFSFNSSTTIKNNSIFYEVMVTQSFYFFFSHFLHDVRNVLILIILNDMFIGNVHYYLERLYFIILCSFYEKRSEVSTDHCFFFPSFSFFGF